MMAIRGHRADHDAWPAGWGWDDVAAAYARSDAHFPRAAQRSPSPLTLDFLESAAADGDSARGRPQRRGQRGRGAHAGLDPPRPPLQRRRRLPATGAAPAQPDGRDRAHAPATARRARPCARRRVPPGWARGGGARRARGRARRRGDRHAEAAPALGDRAAEELERHGIAVVARIARRRPEPPRPPGERGPRHGRRRDALHRRAAAAPARLAGPGRGPLTSNVAEAAAFVRVDPAAAAPDLELIFAPVLFEEEGTVPPSRTASPSPPCCSSRGASARCGSRPPIRSRRPRSTRATSLTRTGTTPGLLLEGVRLARRVLRPRRRSPAT